ncbi:oxaloacetate decarboxylase, gamma subunit [Modicisalibacter ilicicola DSM 19980]|uniref:Probable oxaloacetate decarboxylase gamma chain n=1 Tax=Modicisalibacter ilicicola DSM 19980 TaxID=1121942 RepID=A0A1M4UZC3_9GAMM|nr:OadG family protein [Halomonas ilicicola]SHE61983.1 oxaloacetate decarboxylase, gamma subunit [Halomonas ilicicola DSM 19980]
MDNTSLMQEGLSLMAFGMGFVFVFLTLLVMATTLMSRLVMRFEPAPATEDDASPSSPSDNGTDEQLIAVISAAVRRYRQRHHR